MSFQFNEMSKLVAEDPEKAAAAMRAIVQKGGNAQTIADKFAVTHRTVIRWHARLRAALGDKLGFVLREGRRPNPRKTKRSKKKDRAPKKVVAN